jgi:CheY-like chemotaxis protein
LQELLGQSIALAIRTSSDLHLVKADAGQIDHLLVTLAVRARDVMPDGGDLIFETSNATIEQADVRAHPTAKEGQYVRIGVSDTGRAIDPEEQKRMFEPFAGDDGAGLAFGTLYRNVVDNGGFIDVESIPGEGTTFRIYWPRTTEKLDSKVMIAAASRLPGGTETILLVEQEMLTSDALEKVLKGLGYRVLRANDGVEALKIVARRYLEIDMVISDVLLPGMNGLELGREFMKMRKKLRVLYLSDHAAGSAKNGTALKKVEFLEKPVQRETLAKRVRELLDRPAKA